MAEPSPVLLAAHSLLLRQALRLLLAQRKHAQALWNHISSWQNPALSLRDSPTAHGNSHKPMERTGCFLATMSICSSKGKGFPTDEGEDLDKDKLQVLYGL